MTLKFRFVPLFLFLFLHQCLLGQTAANGWLDLRAMDLNSEIVTLDGEWEFYWGQLLSPSSLDTIQSKDYYSFPELWNDGLTRAGVKLNCMGFGTYRLRVILPENAPQLAFRIKHCYSSYTLYVNGVEYASNGIVAETAAAYKPQWIPAVEDLGEGISQDTMTFDLQIANFSHRKGGAREPIYFSSKKNINGMAVQILSFDLLLTGSLIMAGLFFLGLYFFTERRSYVIYFAVFCLLFSIRIMVADDYSLQFIYPNLDWLVMLRLEYLSLVIPPAFFALYTESLYPHEAYFRLLRWFAVISFFLGSIIVVSSPLIFTWIVEPYLIMLISGLLIHGITYIRAFRNRRPGANFAVLSAGVILIAASYKIMIYVTGVREVEIVPFIGFVSFFLFQSLILFFIFTNSLKKAKEEAEAASRSKSEFLSMMSHEIRTPMNAVVGLTNFLIEDHPKDNQKETLSTLSFSAKNLLVIINDILDFSKIEAKKISFDKVPVDVRAFMGDIESALKSSAIAKGIQLDFYIDSRVPLVIVCDPTRTSQILINLINNAIKFTKEGSVNVSVEFMASDSDSVELEFRIKDTGIGIPLDMQEEIFKSFTQGSKSTTREFGGTGLGLSITRELLLLQEVGLKLESEPGKGSTFHFVQKFEIGELSQSALDFEQSRHVIKGCRILLVEDNDINVMVAKKFLSKWGADITVARNGQEALDTYNDSFELVIMDLQMPIMDGYEASRKLRELGSKVPILALTASALIEEQRRIYSAGIDDFVTKPFDPQMLLEKIQKYVNTPAE